MTRTLKQQRDLFFISSDFYNKITDRLQDIIVVPKSEFKNHTIYNSIHANCCYKVWQINYEFVIVTQEGWYEKQTLDFQRELFKEQLQAGSNMIDRDHLITIHYWNSLSALNQNKLISLNNEHINNYSSINEKFEKWNSIFPNIHGGNCFAATIYGVTNNESLLNEWIHQDTFKSMLKRHGYQKSDEIRPGSVLVFHNENFQHACYVIDNEWVFNKSGQTFWNPWHVTTIEEVQQDWRDFHMKILTNTMG